MLVFDLCVLWFFFFFTVLPLIRVAYAENEAGFEHSWNTDFIT